MKDEKAEALIKANKAKPNDVNSDVDLKKLGLVSSKSVAGQG